MNLRFYFNKLKANFFPVLPREIGTKKTKLGIPVLVVDLKTKQSFEYISIAEAARFFNTHPKTIWRVVYFNKLYLNRYQITEKRNKELGVAEFLFLFYNKFLKFYYKVLYIVKSYKTYFYRKFLFILILFSICIIVLFLIIIIKDVFDQYIFALQVGKAHYNKCVWEHKVLLNGVLSNTDNLFTKASFNDIKLLRYEDIYIFKWIIIYNTNDGISIYQSINNEINLDFNIQGSGTFSGINSSYSSPIIERVNINYIFSNAIASTNNVSDNANSLGIQGINYNRNTIIVNNNIMSTRVRTTELLNYQSNILYCLVNGISPSTF